MHENDCSNTIYKPFKDRSITNTVEWMHTAENTMAMAAYNA